MNDEIDIMRIFVVREINDELILKQMEYKCKLYGNGN